MVRAKAAAAPVSRIPKFSSYEEEAEFWDTHSFEEFADELVPVELKLSPSRLTHGLTVRLDTSTLSLLRASATTKGMAPTTLIRQWIKEKLREDNLALIERLKAEGKVAARLK